jgi:hypothetical protein
MVADKKDWIFIDMVPPPDFSGAWAGRRIGGAGGEFVGGVGDRVFWVV